MASRSFASWIERYVGAVAATRSISRAASIIPIALAIVEGVRVITAIQLAEDLSYEAVWSGSVPPVLFVLAFGGRFLYLLKQKYGIAGLSVTWWSCVFALLLSEYALHKCLFDCGPSFAIYDLFSGAPLQTVGSLFLFFGTIKYCVIAGFAAVGNRE